MKRLAIAKLTLAVFTLAFLAGCANQGSATSSRAADCRQISEQTGDRERYGDCMRGIGSSRMM